MSAASVTHVDHGTVADVLALSSLVQTPDGAATVPELRARRAAAEAAGAVEVACATRFVEAIWWMGRDPAHGEQLLVHGAGDAHAAGLTATAAALEALRLVVAPPRTLDWIGRTAAVAVLLEGATRSRDWTARGWNALARSLLDHGLYGLADEMYARAHVVAEGDGDDHVAGAAAGNRLVLRVDEACWLLLLGREHGELAALGHGGWTEPPAVAPPNPHMARWMSAHREALLVLLEPAAPTRALEQLRAEPVHDRVGADMRAVALVGLAHRALLLGHAERAEHLVAALDRNPSVHIAARPHLVTWLSSRVALARHGDVVAPLLAHARLAWGRVEAQREAHEAAVRASIAAQRGLDEHRLLRQQAYEDALTGLGNRRAFQQLEPGARGDMVVALVDVDDFKSINDTHGHAVGDEVLCALGRVLREVAREQDTVCRIGGDEFVVAARGMGVAVAVERARELRRVLADQPWSAPDLVVTVSIGIGAGAGDRGALVAAADAALYRVKAAGGDGVASATTDG